MNTTTTASNIIVEKYEGKEEKGVVYYTYIDVVYLVQNTRSNLNPYHRRTQLHLLPHPSFLF